jgi:hypothetical protein
VALNYRPSDLGQSSNASPSTIGDDPRISQMVQAMAAFGPSSAGELGNMWRREEPRAVEFFA